MDNIALLFVELFNTWLSVLSRVEFLLPVGATILLLTMSWIYFKLVS